MLLIKQNQMVLKKKQNVEERMKMIVNFDTELALFRQMALVSVYCFFSHRDLKAK